MKDILLDYVKALKKNDKKRLDELKDLIPKEIREAIKDIIIKGKADPKALRKKKLLRLAQRDEIIERRKELENEAKSWQDILFLVLCGVLPMDDEAIDYIKNYIKSIDNEIARIKDISI